jgi:FtsP/CotA-like multicopper oxidase with cupredoxin domain
MSTDLPPTPVRVYVQIDPTGTSGIALTYPDGSPILNASGQPVFGLTTPQYLGPIIISQRDRPVRILFDNYLPPTGMPGYLYVPVDTTYLGASVNGTGTQGAFNGATGGPSNRAVVHLHGGVTPWISDGTPQQDFSPANETTGYTQGPSWAYVPDMPLPPQGSVTLFYTNHQSARFMFYHDHALALTRLNVYDGLAAGYLIQDTTEQALVAANTIPATQIPLVIQDKTFVPDTAQLMVEDPTWDTAKWGGLGSLWFPHVYMPNQNPYNVEGANPMGRWDYGPWFWPPFTGLLYGPVTNPYYDPVNAPWEPPYIPGTPNPSGVPEGFMDTPVVNGTVYPTLTVPAGPVRFRILNAANDRYFNLQRY